MNYHEPPLTSHAARRMAQRNVSLADAALVILYGAVEHRTGVEFYFLGHRNIPPGRERELEGLVGTTVVVRRGRIRTVYRNRRALSSIRRKSKRPRPARLPALTTEGLPVTFSSDVAKARGKLL